MNSIINFFDRFFGNKTVRTILNVLGILLGLSFIFNPLGQGKLTLIFNGVFLTVFFFLS